MTSELYSIISRIMQVPIDKINEDMGPESVEKWDSFNSFVLLDYKKKNSNL